MQRIVGLGFQMLPIPGTVYAPPAAAGGWWNATPLWLKLLGGAAIGSVLGLGAFLIAERR